MEARTSVVDPSTWRDVVARLHHRTDLSLSELEALAEACWWLGDIAAYLRNGEQLHDRFIGPRFLTHAAALEMHPLDTADRVPDLHGQHGVGFCNITKCCTNVCPEHITITDNAIIPLKERVVDRMYDPITRIARFFRKT